MTKNVYKHCQHPLGRAEKSFSVEHHGTGRSTLVLGDCVRGQASEEDQTPQRGRCGISEWTHQKIPQMEGTRGNGQAHSEPRKTSKIQIKFSRYSHWMSGDYPGHPGQRRDPRIVHIQRTLSCQPPWRRHILPVSRSYWNKRGMVGSDGLRGEKQPSLKKVFKSYIHPTFTLNRIHLT